MSKQVRSKCKLCCICNFENPPLSTRKVQPSRIVKRKSEVADILWNKCDVCRRWCHAVCNGLTLKDYKRLTAENQFFKCVLCCTTASCSIRSVQLEDIVESCSSLEGLSSVASTVVSPSPHCQSASTALEVSEHSIDLRSHSAVVEHHKDSCEISLLGTAVESSSLEALQNTVSHKASGKSTAEGKIAEADSQSERHNIVTVDNIPEPAKFRRSDSILKEVKKYAPLVKIKFAYSLAKGGVAIHTHCDTDKKELLNSLSADAFGGATIHDLGDKDCIVLLRNVPSYIDTETTKDVLKARNLEVKCVQRYVRKRTGRPLPVLKLACSEVVAAKLLEQKVLTLGHISCEVVTKHVCAIRCYNCQKFGHTARVCTAKRCCINCADNHLADGFCSEATKCANCQGSHRASDRTCPVYRERNAILASKYSEFKYIKASSRTHDVDSSIRGTTPTKGMERCQSERLSASNH